jgi:hypothetical protein
MRRVVATTEMIPSLYAPSDRQCSSTFNEPENDTLSHTWKQHFVDTRRALVELSDWRKHACSVLVGSFVCPGGHYVEFEDAWRT